MSDAQSDKPVEMFDALFSEASAALALYGTLRARIKSEVEAILDAQTDALLRKASATDLKQALPKVHVWEASHSLGCARSPILRMRR
nr:hypothetical protein [Rhodococcus sp. (in: high G+C Gram-positive bacteria)]